MVWGICSGGRAVSSMFGAPRCSFPRSVAQCSARDSKDCSTAVKRCQRTAASSLIAARACGRRRGTIGAFSAYLDGVPYNPRTVTGQPPVVVDYESFQEPPTALFRDYLKGEPRVRPFYEGGGGWDVEALVRSADRTLTLSRPRR